MTPDDDRARARFATLSILRAGGVIVMLVGLLFWHSSVLREGGHAPLGSALFLIGVLVSLMLPPWLIRRWREGDGR